jgi:Short C-terminal domain
MFKKALIVSIPLLFTACGTFQLANNIQAPVGKTTDQEQSDILVCKDQAKMAASTAGKQAEGFLLGMTIVGAPAAYDLDKKTQRETFAKCMRAKGYTVQVADDSPKPAIPAPTPQPQQIQQPQVTQNTSPVFKNNDPLLINQATNISSSNSGNNNAAARLEALKNLKDKGLISQADYDKKKKEILNSM